MVAVTRDALSGWYCPANNTEWTTLLAGTGIGNPSNLWGCQDASGNLTDAIGTAPLAPVGTAAAMHYQQPIPGWSRFAATLDDGNNARWSSTDASLPNLATTSAMLLIYWVGPLFTSSAIRNIAQIGTTSSCQLRTVTQYRVLSGSNPVTGTVSLTNSVQLLAVRINITASTVTGNDFYEQLSPTFAAMTGQSIYLGGASSAGLSAQEGYLMAALWSGAAAEMTDAQLGTLYDLITTGPPTQPNFEDVVGLQDPPTSLLVAGQAVQIGSQNNSQSLVFSNDVGALSLVGSAAANATVNLPDASGTVAIINALSVNLFQLTNGALVFSNLNNVSFGISNNSLTMSVSFPAPANAPVSAAGVSNLGNTAGNTGSTTGNIVLAGGGGLSLSQATAAGTRATLSASLTQSTVPAAYAAGTQIATSGTIVFSNSNGFTYGIATRRFTASMADVRSISAGTTAATGNQIVFSNSGLQFGANGATITAAGPLLSYWENRHDLYSSNNASGSLISIEPVEFPLGISATRLDLVVMMSAASSITAGYTATGALYTYRGSTASLVSSGSVSVSWTSGTNVSSTNQYGGQSGPRYRSMPIGTWNVSPGCYLMAVQLSFPTANVTAAPYCGISGGAIPIIQDEIAQGNYSYYFGQGFLSGPMPASFQLSQLTQTGVLGSGMGAQPYVRLIGTY